MGGTFTDVVLVDGGGMRVAKVPSTPDDQSAGVVAGLQKIGAIGGVVDAIAHGTTVATNALLERRGARTALLTTEGFRDIVEIGRQARPSLYDLTLRPSPPLVPRELRFSVRERMGPTGVLVALDDVELAAVAEVISRAGVEAVAVCFLFSFLDPSHEQQAGAALAKALPGTQVSLSSEALPEIREYERFSTTTADAYLAPVLERYLTGLGDRLTEARLPAPLVMQSSGGVVDLGGATERPSSCLLSGPAAGVIGATYAAAGSGRFDLLTFDMGGTSTDVSLVVDGEAQSVTSAVVDGVPIRHPMVDLHTISAGGGSLVWADHGGALRVGPRSAGARPGPACYGLEGEQATVTDADLFLGYLADSACLGGEVVLHLDRAERALATVGSRLGLSPLETAIGAVKVAEAEMARALRVVSLERGFDPRQFTLVAFGGAGGMHACDLADELDIGTVLVPRAGGALSALGLAVSDLRRDYSKAFIRDLDHLDKRLLDQAFETLEAKAMSQLPGAELRRLADLRYSGQSFELTVQADSADRLAEHFLAAHRRLYGFELTGESIQVVCLRLTATLARTKPDLVPAVRSLSPAAADTRPTGAGPAGRRTTKVGAPHKKVRRKAYFNGRWRLVPVYDLYDDLPAGTAVQGPAIVQFPGATCVVQPGWKGVVDKVGALTMERK